MCDVYAVLQGEDKDQNDNRVEFATPTTTVVCDANDNSPDFGVQQTRLKYFTKLVDDMICTEEPPTCTGAGDPVRLFRARSWTKFGDYRQTFQ